MIERGLPTVAMAYHETMQATIRDWSREDVGKIVALWLEALAELDPGDVPLRPDAEARLRPWLVERLRERTGLGLIAEVGGAFGGFLLGRVGEWDSSPPILRTRRIGLIDVVCVADRFRKQGIGSALVSHAVGKMESRGVERLETNFQAGDLRAARLWARMGFVPSLQRAWRPPGPAGGT